MKAKETLLFFVLIILALAVISAVFPYKGIAFAGRRLFFPKPEEIFFQGESRSIQEKMEAMERSLQMRIYEDSITKAKVMARNDSLLFFASYFADNPARIHFPAEDSHYLDTFFYQLQNRRADELIHILHYGDSQIESDRITGLLRQKLQERFGGSGPGLLPLVQPIPSLTMGQSATENIARYIISGNLINRANHNRYGIMGQVAAVDGSSYVTIGSRRNKENYDSVRTFSKIRLFVGRSSEGFEAELKTSNNSYLRKIEGETSRMRTLTWNLPAPISKFSIRFGGRAELTAIALDGNRGIAVDNIPLRGSSGTFFTSIDPSSIAPAMRELNVKLILMEFGGNTVPSIKKQKNLDDYKSGMMRQIAFLQKIHPQAKIILIGPADMSTRVNGRLQSYPFLKETIQILKEAALESGVAFWNMYEVMGGENSMVDWVKEKPALAASDYIHFTPKGANRIAELFYESLMVCYDFYEFTNRNTETEE
ncbi:MAG: GDSL-type esterase/lipase family protein [Dysgonamonadaceae bacterium]|jgi:lysophospholipase L1-like esterase|nr:GDSL-type esterase/lipase family protein [Dysgonamonadaceae bacterium]